MSEQSRRTRQLMALAWGEVDRSVLGRRGIPVWILAGLPILLGTVLIWARSRWETPFGLAELQGIWAGLFQGLVLRTVVFFGAMWIFVNLIRGEVVDRTLHLSLMLPVPRPMLLAGKFLGAWVASAILLGGATAVAWLVFFREQLSHAPIGQMFQWSAIVVLGVLGYGAIFGVLGVYLRNPIFAAIALWAWEWLEFLLPGPLKKLSVVHYLKGLAPVRMDEGPLAIVGTTTHPALAIGGLLVFAAALLALGAWSLKRIEIDYGGE